VAGCKPVAAPLGLLRLHCRSLGTISRIHSWGKSQLIEQVVLQGAVRPAGPPPYDGKATAEVHDYHYELTGVLAPSLAKRAPGYTSLNLPDPRKLP
jgi:hypothetical protein